MTEQSANKTIGIVGGMGPEAGYALGNSILRHTHAATDQEHLPVVLLSFPGRIGDRTAFLEGRIEENPGYEIAKLILELERLGAEVAGLACNTAHASKIFHIILKELIAAQSHVKLLNMPWETCRFIRKNYPHIRRIGLMTSNGTYQAQIYRSPLEKMGYEIIVPEFDFQNEVIHRLIYDPDIGIKANPGTTPASANFLLNRAIDFFDQNQAELIVMGCTEIPMVLTGTTVKDMILVNPTDVLARALIDYASANPDQNKTVLSIAK